MKRLTTSLSAAALLLACVSPGAAREGGAGCRGLGRRVAALAAEYRELRERRRRLPEGTYDEDLCGHGGRLHRVLAELGTALGRPPRTRRQVVACLGEPDDVKVGREMTPLLGVYERERRKAGLRPARKAGREYLIYHWRGGHDLMFFVSEGGRIVDRGWWFAYE